MAEARTEAARIVEAVQAERDRLDAEAEKKRSTIQEDFEIAMADRRSKVMKAVDDLEADSKAEAERRLADATAEAKRRLQAATEQSERRIAHAKELAEELRVLRGRVLAQLLGIRGQLDSVPAMLASVNRESELLDAPLAPDDLEIDESLENLDPADESSETSEIPKNSKSGDTETDGSARDTADARSLSLIHI